MAIKKKQKKVRKIIESPFKDYWTKLNYIIFAVGLAVLVIGYFLMGQGPYYNPISLTISPIVLLIAYLILFPLSIFLKNKRKTEQD
jgi:ABC-type Fe3+ transport system permease subunit